MSYEELFVIYVIIKWNIDCFEELKNHISNSEFNELAQKILEIGINQNVLLKNKLEEILTINNLTNEEKKVTIH